MQSSVFIILIPWLIKLLRVLFFVWCKDDEVFLEAQVQNITSSPMVMESVQLEPSAVYSVTDLNFMPADQKKDVSGWDERQCTFNDLHCNVSLGNYWITPFFLGGGGRSEISAVISCWQLAFLASYCSSKISRLLEFENNYRKICGINDQLLFLHNHLKTIMTALKVRDNFSGRPHPLASPSLPGVISTFCTVH